MFFLNNGFKKVQYNFIGYPVNLIINNPTATHWIVVALGYLFLSVAIFLINKNFFNDIYIEKILYFTPFF